jgi:hypothetical protein
MEYTTHISISELGGQSVVTVDDYELFDFLDDFFAEQHIKTAFVSKALGPDGVEHHSIHFDPPYTVESLLRLVRGIPVDEIERIYQLNSGQTKP